MKIKSIFNIIYLEEKIMINTGNETIEIFPIDRLLTKKDVMIVE